jgi:flagellar basal-body rod protein FlgF/flagellar basal-body rod protein FlgG
MVSGKYSALSGAITRQQSIDNTSANLANVTTIGYKKTRTSFESMLRGERQIQDTKGINYNRMKGNYVDFSQGPLQQTENPFDVAIHGSGFFKIRNGEQDLLTRKGNFILDATGRLLTDTGMPVLDNGNGEIVIATAADAERIVIDSEGNIASVGPQGETAIIAQLAIVDVEDRTLLQPEKDTAFSLLPGALEIPAEEFSLVQGSLEMSNVNMTDEMSKMIYDNRLFQAYHNVLEGYSKLGEKLGELGTLG